MAKPTPRRVPSDDCLVTVDGVEYAVHEEEWVDLLPGMNVQALAALEGLHRIGVTLNTVKGEPDEYIRALEAVNRYFDDACAFLAGRVVAWNWTDLKGNALPDPSLEVLKALDAGEILWLLEAAQGETKAQRKNALAPSPTTSSAIGSPATGAKRNISARSRTRQR